MELEIRAQSDGGSMEEGQHASNTHGGGEPPIVPDGYVGASRGASGGGRCVSSVVAIPKPRPART